MTRETYPVIFEKYKEWRELSEAVRKAQKFPLNQREFAIHHGVNQATLSMWNKKIDEGCEYNGEFNLKEHLRANLQDIADSLLKIIKTSKNAKAIELALKALGELVEKREETVKLEYTPADHTRIARETIDGLRTQHQQFGGVCVVCGQHKALRNGTRLDSEPEQQEDREVATVALSDRPL